MRTEYVGVLLEGVIPILGGTYGALLGFRVVGPKPGAKPKHDEWYRRWGGFMRVCGPLLVVFGLLLWVKGFVFHSDVAPTPATAWTRHKSSDGAVSVEFPGPPKTLTKEAEGLVFHNVTLSEKERDRHFILSWSEAAQVDGITDEERLDGLRESIPAMTAERGMPFTFVRDEKFTEGGVTGRLFVFDFNGKYTQRMKCLILNGRAYRATATTRNTPQEEADGVRFVSSFRLEKAEK
jgi:hypothetical protein